MIPPAEKHWFPTESGTPQGGIISPIIANMVLDGLEEVINLHAHHKPNSNRQWIFSATDKKHICELPLFDATKIIRHIKIKSLSNPYDKEWDDYFKERAKSRLAKHKNISKLATAI